MTGIFPLMRSVNCVVAKISLGSLPVVPASCYRGKVGSEMDTKYIDFSGKLFFVKVKRLRIEFFVPHFRISKRGIGMHIDTVFEVTKLQWSGSTVIDILLLGFGVSIELEAKNV